MRQEVRMDELSKNREIIAGIDEEMAKLFEKRMELAAGIAGYKKEHGIPVKDRTREKNLIDRNRGFISKPEHEEYYVDFLKGMIDISCRYQERLLSGMKVAYSGVEGSFAYIAARTMFKGAALICKNDFNQAYHSVELGECDCAVLPLENSYAGEVNTVMDLAF
ncbi:MAG: chorismate mutase, partial [Lachnospiraceae bacterium]|nr:chorismate mutase [Lachnospiraceae bacterium]